MIIFKSAENFCGFLFFVATAAGFIGIIVLILLEGYRKGKEKYLEKRKRLNNSIEL